MDDKKFTEKLMSSTLEEYLDIYPTSIDGYKKISDFADGKKVDDQFVCKMKPKKPTKQEFVVLKGYYLDPTKVYNVLEKEVTLTKKTILNFNFS